MVRPGILLVDKPGGITSHDVVSRARRALGTRKIGHAGTLDPMATGLLVLGVEGATRLLTYIVGADKTYEATILLGVSTDSDDADGVETSRTDATAVTDDAIAAGIADLTGDIEQVPSTVSAIKVAGRRAYDLARAGEEVELKARRVTVSRFDVRALRRGEGVVELDVVVDCTSGTYIRALARDLGRALGVGGHLTMLRRTRIGAFDVAAAASVDDIAEERLVNPATAASVVVGAIAVGEDEARDLRHGKRIDGGGRLTGAVAAAIDPDGRLVGIVEKRGAQLKSVMNMPEEVAR
ncbi:tRNA pseudouridine(55) synthase TruB [Microbacterium sp. Kw_RZR3]|jgi:tRNA pseudouridine55 synthase|uniref:tRNA pseudouridine(55) synthase TruB n=1 Tax=Microbacterium sp. Kw_RZR3 TaxID=3032903 RepID=UPI0023DBF225|nr:tRNA pseudouridine(55) synthase TruB [Microbacterium sp. Kw_RZR3]MDF2046868.1 tRNA pseudouridine(55) synthase TruB [Microbacterium sp. Kw_RZR3]